jgi:hypothetical protein
LGGEEPVNNPIKIRAFKILRGHRGSVQSVAAQTSGDMVFLFPFSVIFIDIYVGKTRFQVKLITFLFLFWLHALRFVQVLGIARSIYGGQRTTLMVICQLRREK